MSVACKLKQRADMLAQVRDFFSKRQVTEVDTPILSHTAPIATHIDIMEVSFRNGQKGYLHSSPEYAMKRLLAKGSGDIYQLSHVFRDGELGDRHNIEFTMLEWYRIGWKEEQLIQETLDLIGLFIPPTFAHFYTYAQAFQQFANIDYRQATAEELQHIAQTHNLSFNKSWDKLTMLDFCMGFIIEPQLKGLSVITEYPPAMAALATTTQKNGHLVANRFEIYYNTMELANGFHELTDPIEQRRRFQEDNATRESLGKQPLPIDEKFLQALSNLPDCSGVAVGFDRLLMVQQNAPSINTILPFSWEES